MTDLALLPTARPILRWAGGKTQLLSEIFARFPRNFNRYHEPFIGSGAVFFALSPNAASIADTNAHLVQLYQHVQTSPEGVSRELVKLEQEFNNCDEVSQKDLYRRRREEFNQTRGRALRRSALLVFLSKTGFNGMYRENAQGKFNIPFNGRRTLSLPTLDHLRACQGALVGAEILKSGFESILHRAVSGDLVYLDPPYTPRSKTQAFTAYQAAGFGLADHERLAQVVKSLHAREVAVLVSQSDTPTTRELYAGFRIDQVFARRSINSRGTGRGLVAELLIRNY